MMEFLYSFSILFRKYLLFILILFLTSCSHEKNKIRPSSMGGINEIILVTDFQKTDSSFKEEVFDILTEPYPALINLEKHFRLLRVPLNKFSSYYKKQRNLIFIRKMKNDSLSSPEIFEKKNQWASPQKIVFINYSTKSSLLTFLEKMVKPIFSGFHDSEIAYIQKTHSQKTPSSIAEELKKNKLRMTVPKNFVLYQSSEGFIWIGRESYSSKKDIKLGVFIHLFPYSDKAEIEGINILRRRNRVTKRYISGQVDSSYMKIENLIPVVQKRVTFNGNYAIKTRGMWKLEKDFMGGTFINISFINEKKTKIIMVDGYLYAPNEDKGIFMSELEAVITSTTTIK